MRATLLALALCLGWTSAAAQEVDWVRIPGTEVDPLADWKSCGTEPGYCMGTTEGYGNEWPIHKVVIKSFLLSRSHVTAEQFAACVGSGLCDPAELSDGSLCTFDKAKRAPKPGKERHPINCVSWKGAVQFASSIGGRLPSESEYEYAARSRGKDQVYPWGNEVSTCERVVMWGGGDRGCGSGGTLPVCSRPKGNSEQGVCDLAGNVWNWTADYFHGSYRGAPADGAPRAEDLSGLGRLARGGDFTRPTGAKCMRARTRDYYPESTRRPTLGFRVAKTLP